MSDRRGRIGLTLLGGFLGSGKTTWLRHQLHTGRFADAHVIVNEAAEMPVDDALLGKAGGLSVLAGGCACCDGRTALIALLRELCDQRSKAGPDALRIADIVLETSGLADPGPIVTAIRADPVLLHHVTVDRIIVAVDAVHGLSQLQREALGRRQTELADHLVVTKTDVADDAALRRLLATLRVLNPAADISAAVNGVDMVLPDFSGTAPLPLLPLDGSAPRPPVFATVLTLDQSTDWAALTLWLSALLHARGDDVLRVKGVLVTPAGRLLLQSVRKIMQQPEILPAQPPDGLRRDNSLAIIGSGYDAADLARSLRHFAAAATPPA